MARFVFSPGGVPEPFVIGFMGQSDFDYLMLNSAFYISNQPFPTIPNPNCALVLANEGADTVAEIPITNATIAANQVNLGMASLAAFLGWNYPDRTFKFLDLAVVGTGRKDLYDDADTDRQWSDFQRVLDYATTTFGKDPDVIIEHWYASDQAFLGAFGENFAPFYIGQRWNGGGYTLGTAHPDNAALGVIDHCLWDAAALPDEKGRGVFTRDRTKLVIHRRMNYAGGYGTWAAETAALEAFVADPRVPALPLASEPVHAITDSGGWHVIMNDPDGQQGWARALMESVTRALGRQIASPSVAGVVMGGVTNLQSADIVVNLPNGGDLTTFLALEGRAFSEELESRQPVMGAEIRRVGDTEAQRQPVWPLAETGRPAGYRGTVEIVDPGSGSPRQGRIRVTPEVPFAAGDMLYFNWLNSAIVPGGTTRPNADPLKPWMGYAVETVPGLRDAAATYPFVGVPVRFFPAAHAVAAGFTYTQAVTSVDEVNENGDVERAVTAPAHLATYDAGEGLPGLYRFRPADVMAAPVVLYPGQIAMSAPQSGGTISLAQAPWAVGLGPVSIAYRVMFGDTQVASTLPYATVQAAGSILRVLADVTASNGTTTVEAGRITIAENPLGPQLSGFSIDYATNTISFTSDLAATVTWRRYPPGHVFVNPAAEVLAGTGAIDGGSFSIASGPNTQAVTFTGGISGSQEIWIVARVGSGPISNVIGGPVTITVTTGSPLTAPNFRGSSIGGNGSSAGVASVSVPLPAYQSGDLVTLPIGIDCRASFIVGLTATGPNGEVATVKQALVDNEEGGNSAAAIALLYYRATAANTSGSVTISIAPGGFKSLEQIVCTPIVRFSVRATGDPFAQVVRTFSTTATATATTAALTAVSAASRIEACFINDVTLPPGTAPSGWFMREAGLIGPQAIQTMSRNSQTESAGQSIAAASVPLGATAQRWVCLTWELLPLGA
jgi:hypothetical protein